MADPASLDAESMRHAFIAAAQSVIDAKNELGSLDAAAGDGDLGVTMEKGFVAVRDALESAGPIPIHEQVRSTGEILANKAPSTMGTLLGNAFLMSAPSLDAAESMSGRALADLLSQLSGAISRLGRASTGQRTVLDAMEPSARAAGGAADKQGVTVSELVETAAEAAENGAESTAGMEPKLGRARWTAERASGVIDGGARAWAIWLRGLSHSVRQRSAPARPTEDKG